MISKEPMQEKFTRARRLHPAAIIFSFISTIKETIFGFGLGLIFTIKESFVYFFVFIFLFVLLLTIYSLLAWLRFTYYIEDDELRIEQGVFIRKKRYISKHRIHKIDLTANVVHRLFKLVKVQIDTASNSGVAEVSLSAIGLEDAIQLRSVLQKETIHEAEGRTDKEKLIKKISWRRLFITGSTSGSAGIIVIAVLTVFTQVEELIPRKFFNTAYSWIMSMSFVFFILMIILLAFLLWIFGIAGTMIRYGNFTIEKRREELLIKRGLLETKELTIPYERIQAVGIEQSLIREPFGYVRIFAIVAGGSFDRHEVFPILFPLMHKREVKTFLEDFLPDYCIEGLERNQKLPKRSILFYLAKSLVLPSVVLVATLLLLPSMYWITFIVLAFTFTLALMRFKDLRFGIKDDYFTFQKRRMKKEILITSRRRVQSFEKSVHKLQSLRKVASISISLIGMQGLGTHYSLDHLDERDAEKIGQWFSYRKDQKEKDYES